MKPVRRPAHAQGTRAEVWNVNRRPVHYACDVTDDMPPATSSFRAQILAQTYATVIVARPDAVWRDPRYAASLVATDDGRERRERSRFSRTTSILFVTFPKRACRRKTTSHRQLLL